METEISKSKSKAHVLEIIRRVESTGAAVVITRNGTPQLIVSKYEAKADDARDRLKGSVLGYAVPLAPVGSEDWEGLA